jgi:Family of unknown function (DUF6866) N-terminal domain/Family of unknown function (DUF6866) C-terminal domain
MADTGILALQVKRNCNISDAKYWGTYSICGFLLRLRELYRIEKCIRPWEKIEQEEMGQWISERESLWKELETQDFADITVNGNSYGPFEVEKLNAELGKKGLVYGAGFGNHMKPSFFLADLISKSTVEGCDVYIAGSEHARDLAEYPAMLQDRTIYVRVDTTRVLLWEKFEELRFNRTNRHLLFAFSKYDIRPEEEPSEDIYRRIFETACSEVQTYIYHELGEASEDEKLGSEWKTLIKDLSTSRKAEFFARSVKDFLSDTCEKGMLRHIIENRKEGSLGFYIVYLHGYRKLLFPEIFDSFYKFAETGDWVFIDDARKGGYRKAEEYAERLLSVYKKHKSEKEWISIYVEQEMISGLT